jgi:hypothetical protein
MHRSMIAIVCCCCALLCGLGCAKMRSTFGMDNGDPAKAMHEMKKPEQPAEMKRLEMFVGNWTGTAEMVTPPKPARKSGSTTAPATQPQQTTMNGGSTGKWELNGQALRMDGWYEMPNGERVSYIEYWMWDPQAKKYHTTFMSEMGEYGEGWATPDATGRNFTYTGRSNRSKVSGTMRMTDDRTMEWNMTEKGPHGKMQMKGTSRKQ